MIQLTAPDSIVSGKPFKVEFQAESRVAGRLRLTSGTDLVPFRLEREGREPTTGTQHRVRGRSGVFTIADWGTHEPGVELVVRFEGAKCWMTVQAAEAAQ